VSELRPEDVSRNLAAEAAEGCLFIEEVAGLNPQQQRYLLSLLPALERMHVRLLTSTGRSLARMVNEGSFDPKLYAAIGQVQVRIPSLREHQEDIPELAKMILSRLVESKQVPPRTFTTAALNALRVHDWPGNITQLENVVKSIALLSLANEIGISDVNSAMSRAEIHGVPAMPSFDFDCGLRDARDAFERLYFEYHIAKEGANMSRVAERVGLERTHLYRKLKQLGLKLNRKEQ